MSRKETYQFDSYHPSGNSCKWLYDTKKRTIFMSDTDIKYWKIKPTFGDSITLIRTDNGLTILMAFINGELAFEYTEEIGDVMYEEQMKEHKEIFQDAKKRLNQ